MNIESGYIGIPLPTGMFIGSPIGYTMPWYGTSGSRTVRLYFPTDGTSGSNYGVYLRNASGGVPTGTYAARAYVVGRWK